MICSLAVSPAPAPLTASAGVRRRRVPADPIQSWIDLMELVEILSPRWPPRRRSAAGGLCRL